MGFCCFGLCCGMCWLLLAVHGSLWPHLQGSGCPGGCLALKVGIDTPSWNIGHCLNQSGRATVPTALRWKPEILHLQWLLKFYLICEDVSCNMCWQPAVYQCVPYLRNRLGKHSSIQFADFLHMLDILETYFHIVALFLNMSVLVLVTLHVKLSIFVFGCSLIWPYIQWETEELGKLCKSV